MSAEKELTFASVYYENTSSAAEKRLATLRETDEKYTEIKAYIIRSAGKFRVLRKVKIKLN